MVPHQLLHLLGLALISCKARKKTIVSKSSVEAEYRSMVTTTCELQLCISLLRDFDIPAPLPVPLWCDNLTTLHIMQNSVFHERMKHLDIDCHIVRERFKSGLLLPQNVSSASQPADVIPKSLSCLLFHRLLCKLGLVDCLQPAPP